MDAASMTAVPKPPFTIRQRKALKSRPHVISPVVREAVFARDSMTCQWCMVPGGALDAHHIRRRSQGGMDRADNLVAVHRVCHSRIHDHPAEAKAARFLL